MPHWCSLGLHPWVADHWPTAFKTAKSCNQVWRAGHIFNKNSFLQRYAFQIALYRLLLIVIALLSKPVLLRFVLTSLLTDYVLQTTHSEHSIIMQNAFIMQLAVDTSWESLPPEPQQGIIALCVASKSDSLMRSSWVLGLNIPIYEKFFSVTSR